MKYGQLAFPSLRLVFGLAWMGKILKVDVQSMSDAEIDAAASEADDFCERDSAFRDEKKRRLNAASNSSR